MKIFIDYSEEISFEEEEEENEEEFHQMEPKSKKTTYKFDESSFDVKVAKSITNIHRKQKETNKFSNWVEENYEHLLKLYELSDICIPMETFFTYIYDHSL